MSEEENKTFEMLLDLSEKPIVQDFYLHVAQTAGFGLPPSLKMVFDRHHQHFFSNPCPAFTADWGTTSPNWKWQKMHFESIFGSTQSAVAAVLYHRENLLRIERDVLSFSGINQLISALGESAVGGGNTQKLDFEYHSFIFAYRRTLDYLTRSIAALLRNDFHSFRRLPEFLSRHIRHEWVNEIIHIHGAYASKLDSFLTNQDNKSIRDQIAHYIHVPAGTLNVNARGVFFAGGGEGLELDRRLSIVIDGYEQTLRDILTECLQVVERGFPKGMV